MARSIQEIKAGIAEAFVSQDAIRAAYGLDPAKSFDKQFSPVSVESVMFHVVASCIWLFEKLFDLHRSEVEAHIEAMRPHTLRWYVSKALAYMHDKDLIMEDGVVVADHYDTSGMTAEEIDRKRIVKYAVATEDNTQVILKVAKRGNNGQPAQLKPAELAGLKHYLSQVKDAGVSVRVLNEPADTMRLELLVLYDPSVLRAEYLSEADKDEEFRRITLSRADDSNGADIVAEAVGNVISRLPFNGEYRNSDLLAALQAVDGVRVADIISVRASPGGSESSYTPVVGYRRPYSGYYALDLDHFIVRGREYKVTE